MLFNSLDFAIFLPIVFGLYWFVTRSNLKLQNTLLLVSSYVFYAWWDPRFLGLIVLSTLTDYIIGIQLKPAISRSHRKRLLALSLLVNLGMLGFFKYYNFFIESFQDAFSLFGQPLELRGLSIVLPVGISFYTFQTLSYTIDVYRERITPSKDLLAFATYVAFFPQLVAGPIERASHFLPQVLRKRKFNYKWAVSGVSLIIWGLFKKVVIADNCAFFVNQIFGDPTSFSGLELFLGAALFAFQIYGDFSGYSDIAIGVSRLLGFDLMTNFRFPYLSKNIADFWRRWHISLSTWFRDYLYIPLGGARLKTWGNVRNVLIIFLVSGFWHGANYTFIIWGTIHALLFLPLLLRGKNRIHLREQSIKRIEVLKMILTFILVTVAWIYFRSDNVPSANQYLIEMISGNWVDLSFFTGRFKYLLLFLIAIGSIVAMLAHEIKAYKSAQREVRLSASFKLFYCLLIVFMGAFKNPLEFIYFQF